MEALATHDRRRWARFMKAKILTTEGAFLEIAFEVSGEIFNAMDDISSYDSPASPGTIFDVEFSSLTCEGETWEEMFRGNPKKEKKLEHQGGWSYIAYGEIIKLNPTIVDCGLLQLEAPIHTHDERCLGEYVRFSIDRLEVFLKE